MRWPVTPQNRSDSKQATSDRDLRQIMPQLEPLAWKSGIPGPAETWKSQRQSIPTKRKPSELFSRETESPRQRRASTRQEDRKRIEARQGPNSLIPPTGGKSFRDATAAQHPSTKQDGKRSRAPILLPREPSELWLFWRQTRNEAPQ